MRSRNVSPGFAVTRTTMRSLSTRVPPVTPERSPPASRITGADSPVMADSSTDGDALDDLAVGRDHVAGLDRRRGRRRGGRAPGRGSSTSPGPSRRAIVVVRVLRRLSAWALPRPSASASAKFANSTVSHSQIAIWSSNATAWPCDDVDGELAGDEHRDDPDREDHGVAEERAGIELAERVEQCGASDRPARAARWWRWSPGEPPGEGLGQGAESEGGEEGQGADQQDHADQEADEDRRGRSACCRSTPAGSSARPGPGEAERGQDHEEAAEHHRRAQEVVVVVRRRGQSRERRAVVVPGRARRRGSR